MRENGDFAGALGGVGCRVTEADDAGGAKNGYRGTREGFEAGLDVFYRRAGEPGENETVYVLGAVPQRFVR